MNWRDVTYRLLRISNDVRAVRRGRIGQRLTRRIVGKAAGRAMGRWLP